MPKRRLTDEEALDRIQHWLRDPDWGVGMLEDIAETVHATGRSTKALIKTITYCASEDCEDIVVERQFATAPGVVSDVWVHEDSGEARCFPDDDEAHELAAPGETETEEVSTWGRH